VTDAAWKVRLTLSARADLEDILVWTLAEFGSHQARVYAETLARAIHSLSAGPGVAGAHARPEIGNDIYTLHVARGGRKGRHFALYRILLKERSIDVLRLLHDAMDLKSHIPEA
jgi:toxin ParE1/3/4